MSGERTGGDEGKWWLPVRIVRLPDETVTSLSPEVIRAFESARDGDTCPSPETVPTPGTAQSGGARNLMSMFEPPPSVAGGYGHDDVSAPKRLASDGASAAPAGGPGGGFGGGDGAAAAAARHREAPPKQLVPDSAFDALAGRHVSPFSDPPFGRAFGGFWSALTGRQSPTPAGGPEERR